MHQRAATLDDVPAVAQLQRSWDVHWFGVAEHSVEEVREYFGYTDSPAEDTLLLFDGEQGEHLAAAGFRWGEATMLIADPARDRTPVHDVLLPWFAQRPGRVDVLAQDTELRRRVETSGWRHRTSSFELSTTVSDELKLAEPAWPDGVRITGLDESDAAAVHRMIYVDAGWSEIPGHPQRDFDSWRRLFLDHLVPDEQVIAWLEERVVGAAIGRRWDDGMGWVSQLATAKDVRGRGLGRALLLELLRRHVAAGATSLGLEVQAANERALRMYVDVGLRIGREWRTYETAQPAPGQDGGV
jgi:ribosomal protein S18 acetylase RimI-like enzyme